MDDECPLCRESLRVVVEVSVIKSFIETGDLDEGKSNQVVFEVCDNCGYREEIQGEEDET